jgi:hypothetical protein
MKTISKLSNEKQIKIKGLVEGMNGGTVSSGCKRV